MDRDAVTRELLTKFSEKLVNSIERGDYVVSSQKEKSVSAISTDENGINTGVSWTIIDVPISSVHAGRIIPRINKYYIPIRDHIQANYQTYYPSDIMLFYYADRVIKLGNKQELVDSFLGDLNNVAPSWENQVKLRGLIVNEIVQAGPFTFRKVDINDLSEVVMPLTDINRSTRVPHSILEYNSKRMSPQENVRTMLNIVEVLRFYRSAAVSFESYTNHTASLNFMHLGGTPRIAVDLPYQPTLSLSPQDENHLPNFIEFMEPLLDIIKHQEKTTPVKIAFQRYTDSLINQDSSIETKLVFTISGLEALFSANNQELSYRLKTSLSKLLSYLGEDSQEVSNVMSQSYSCRSRYLHGAILKEKDQENITQLVNKCRDYLRKSILYFLFHKIYSKTERGKFIKSLENALLDQTESSKLQDKAEKLSESLPGVF